MVTKNNSIVIGGIAILVVAGALVVGPVLNDAFSNNKDGMSNTDHSKTDMSASGNSLVQKASVDYKEYVALQGDYYDKAFIANMIIHHEGAVNMAEVALAGAKRQEIKDMAIDIISAQTGEITQMQQWQKDWGYVSSSSDKMEDDGSMSMPSHMAMLMDELKNKTGDDFDKSFVEQMIMHHQGAINMAAPGEVNAKHQEVKDLTKAVLSAQSKEIRQMKQWQEEWRL